MNINAAKNLVHEYFLLIIRIILFDYLHYIIY